MTPKVWKLELGETCNLNFGSYGKSHVMSADLILIYLSDLGDNSK